MKVKAIKIKDNIKSLTQGKEYEFENSMPSLCGGDWVEIVDDIGIPSLIRVGGFCAFGEWEYVK